MGESYFMILQAIYPDQNTASTEMEEIKRSRLSPTLLELYVEEDEIFGTFGGETEDLDSIMEELHNLIKGNCLKVKIDAYKHHNTISSD